MWCNLYFLFCRKYFTSTKFSPTWGIDHQVSMTLRGILLKHSSAVSATDSIAWPCGGSWDRMWGSRSTNVAKGWSQKNKTWQNKDFGWIRGGGVHCQRIFLYENKSVSAAQDPWSTVQFNPLYFFWGGVIILGGFFFFFFFFFFWGGGDFFGGSGIIFLFFYFFFKWPSYWCLKSM